MRDARRFVVVGSVLGIAFGLGAVVSIVAGWPAQFGGRGDPDRILAESVSRGTALAPPLPMFAVVAAAVLLASRDDRLGTIAVGTGMLLSIGFLVGSLGEAVAPDTPDVPRAVLVLSGVVGSTLAVAWFASGLAAIRARIAGRRAGASPPRPAP